MIKKTTTIKGSILRKICLHWCFNNQKKQEVYPLLLLLQHFHSSPDNHTPCDVIKGSDDHCTLKVYCIQQNSFHLRCNTNTLI